MIFIKKYIDNNVNFWYSFYSNSSIVSAIVIPRRWRGHLGASKLPIHTAAYKSLRADIKKRKRNETVKSELKTITKKLESLIAEKKKDEARKSLKIVSAKYMKAASKGVIHKKTASRKISRLAKRINNIK